MVGAQAIIADDRPAARPRPLHGPDRLRVRGRVGRRPAARRLLRRGDLVALGVLREHADRAWSRSLVVVFRLHLHVPTHRHQIDYLGAGAADRGRERADPRHHLGRQRVRAGARRRSSAWRSSPCVLADRASCSSRRRAAEPIIPLKLFRSRVFRVASSTRLPDRPGDVRRDHLHPAVPAARLRRQPDQLRPADAAADGAAC